jgi:hypothetical protein
VEQDSRDDRKAGTATLALSTPLGYAIHYSVDGSPVTAQSPRYTAPLTQPLTGSCWPAPSAPTQQLPAGAHAPPALQYW